MGVAGTGTVSDLPTCANTVPVTGYPQVSATAWEPCIPSHVCLEPHLHPHAVSPMHALMVPCAVLLSHRLTYVLSHPHMALALSLTGPGPCCLPHTISHAHHLTHALSHMHAVLHTCHLTHAPSHMHGLSHVCHLPLPHPHLFHPPHAVLFMSPCSCATSCTCTLPLTWSCTCAIALMLPLTCKGYHFILYYVVTT